MTKPFEIAGYTFRAEFFAPEELAVADGLWSNDYPDDMPVESMLEIEAELRGINREDEYSFESDDFPKVVFADML